MGRLPRVLIFLSFLSSLPPPTTIAQGFSRRTKMYAVTWMDAYKIRPNCWFFFPHLIYRVLYSSASRSKRLSRFVVIIYTRLFMEKIKKSKFFSFLLFQNLPFPLQIRLKFYHTFHILYIYIYIQKTLLYSPRFLASPSRISQTRQLLIDLSHRIHGAFSSRDPAHNRGTDVAIDVDNR